MLALLIVWRSSVGATEFVVHVWDTENGLPDSSVTAISQTPDGYLWVGTYNGLARFDGIRFQLYDPWNTPALSHPRIQELFVDAAGTLWINTYDGGLTSFRDGVFRNEYKGTDEFDMRTVLVSSTPDEIRFSTQHGELIQKASGSNSWDTFRPPQSPQSVSYQIDRDGIIWWFQLGRGEFGRVLDGTMEHMEGRFGLSGSQALSMSTDADGTIWVGTDQELAAWDGQRFVDLTPTNGEPDLQVEFILPTRSGANWVWANNRLRKQVDRQWVTEAREWEGLLGLAGGRNMAGHEDRQGGVWFSHYGKGLFHVTPDGQFVRLTAKDGLPGERIDAWYEDREGNIWVGVDRGGLARLRPKIFQEIGPTEGGTRRTLISACEDLNGNVWLGTLGGGLHVWENDALRQVDPADAALVGNVFSLCPMPNGDLWMSAASEDLYVYSNGRIQPAPWGVHGVKTVLSDQQGRIWAGWKDGVGYWSREEHRPILVEGGTGTPAVRAIVEDREGAIWFGSDDGTLYRFQDQQLDSFRTSDQLSSQPIWALHADADGTLWVGTFRGGLLRFRDGKFTRFTSTEGLPDEIVCQILDDGAGRLWIGSQHGLFHVGKQTLNAVAEGKAKRADWVTYGRLDGLPTLEFSGGYNPSCWRGQDGRMWFATLKGLVSVQPDAIHANPLAPPVVIEELQINDKPIPAIQDGFRSAPGEQRLELRFTALSLSAPERVRFRYRLEGEDPDWVEAGSRRWAQYNHLPPGDYKFVVTACNSDGVWNESGASVAFTLTPHFYETKWFRALLGITVIGLVAAGVRRYAHRQFQQELTLMEQQHAIERDRARIAKDIHDDMGAGLTEISLLTEVARRDPPAALNTHLQRISDSARELMRSMDEIVWAIDPKHDNVEGFLGYACTFAEDYLRLAGIRCRMEVPSSTSSLHLDTDTRHNLFLALKEAVNNIVKHAHATEVWLRVRHDQDLLKLKIEDNGHGITASSPDEDTAHIRARHGIENLETRLASIGGRCNLRSVPGKGTQVEFTVPLEKHGMTAKAPNKTRSGSSRISGDTLDHST